MAKGIRDEFAIPFLSYLLDRRGQVDLQWFTATPGQNRLPVLDNLLQSFETPAENLTFATLIQPLAYRLANNFRDTAAFPPGDLG
jgi:hypothetical protein